MQSAFLKIPLTDISKIVNGFLLAASWRDVRKSEPEVWEWEKEATQKAVDYVNGWLEAISAQDYARAVSGTRYLPCFAGSPLVALGAYLFWEMSRYPVGFSNEKGLHANGLAGRLQAAARKGSHHVTVYIRDNGKGTFA